MIDLTRTLFRLSLRDQVLPEDLVFEEVSRVSLNVCQNHDVTDEGSLEIAQEPLSLSTHEFQPPIKFLKLEDIDVDSIRETQTQFLNSLHHLHFSE